MNDSKSVFIDIDYQAIFDASPDATFILGLTGRILNANLTAIQRYDYSLEELRQFNICDLATADLQGEALSRLNSALKSGATFDFRHRFKDGREMPVEIYAEPVILQGETVVLFRVRDISRRKTLEAELHNRKYLLESILDAEPGTVYIYDLAEQQNIYVNRHLLAALGYQVEKTATMGPELNQIIYPGDLPGIAASHEAWRDAEEGEIRSMEYRLRNVEADWHWLMSRETVFARDERGRVSRILGIVYDITPRKRSEKLLGGQQKILEMITTGVSLQVMLDALVCFIEDMSYEMLCSVLLLDEEGTHVRHGAAPSLPAAFVAAVDGQPIGPVAGSCGTAAYRKEAVYVEDIATDPLWENYKAAALLHGLRACWSTPILDLQGKVLGTFAIYYRKAGLPKPEHLELISTATHIAAIAITYHRNNAALHINEERLRLALNIANQSWFDVDLQTGITKVGAEYPAMIGFAPDDFEASVQGWLNDLHPEDHDAVLEAFQSCLASGDQVSMEYRRRTKSGGWMWMHSIGKVVEWDHERKPARMIGILMDITERKSAENKVQRLTRLYAALSQCNQAIVRCTSEAELLPQICRDAVNFGGMKMAWIGMLDEMSQMVRPVAVFGASIEYLDGIEISADDDNPSGQGPSGTAIRENRPVWCQDFQHDVDTLAWHDRAAKFDWGASASLPLQRKGVAVGAFTLYTGEVNAFDEAAQHLLIEMAMDISFALDRFFDENERKQEQTQLRKLSQVVEQSPNVIMITDLNEMIEYVNPAFVKTTGYSAEEVMGKSPRLLQSGKTAQSIYEEMWSRLKLEENWHGELINKRKDGTEYIESVHISPMRGVDGRVSHYLGIKEDITERRQVEERIQYLAHFDALTGLPNRSELNDHSSIAFSHAKRSHAHLALMFLDLDHFKDINDTLGHSVGDALLIALAKRIKLALREEDTVSRLGGDEFILLLPGADVTGAAQVAQKMLDHISEPYHIGLHELSITASIGIAIYPDDGVDMEMLFKNADVAMYRAKNEGRNGYRFFTLEMQIQLSRNMQLLSALRNALKLDQLQIHYQPQISLRDGKLIGMEALLRWQHPEFGMVSPGEFIPVAESSGLILSIGEWVLRTAVKQAKGWQQAGLAPIILAVNLSAVQFRHPDLPDLVSRVLEEAELSPEYLELELTESTTMQDPLGAIAVMNNLHQRGVRMSIDDFGTGYSSLSYLKKFRVYKLKIDQSFVRDISTDPEDKAIVVAIISLAKGLGMQTIAEGVETIEQLNFLREHGCDEVQGYYYSKPLPVKLFGEFARATN